MLTHSKLNDLVKCQETAFQIYLPQGGFCGGYCLSLWESVGSTKTVLNKRLAERSQIIRAAFNSPV